MDSAIRRQGSTASMLKIATYGAILALREAGKSWQERRRCPSFYLTLTGHPPDDS